MDAALPPSRISHLVVSCPVEARIRVYEWGEQGQKTVILVNAFATSAELWGRVIADLTARGFYVLTWDTRGLEDSDVDPDTAVDCSFGAHLRDLNAVIAFSKAPRVDLVGWCTGALIVLKAISLAPKQIGKAVVLGGCFNILPRNAYQGSQNTLMATAGRSRQHAELFLKALRSGGPKDAKSPAMRGKITAHISPDVEPYVGISMRSVGNLYNYGRMIYAYSQENPVAWLASISRPILILIGEKDEMANYAEAVAAAEAIPGAKLLSVPDQDHFLHYRDGEASKTIGAFLESRPN